MKTKTIIKAIAVTVLAFVCNSMYSSNLVTPNSNNDTLYLKITGKVSKTKESAGQSYTVQLIQNDKVVSEQIVKAGKNFNFYLNRNSWYGVRINKHECVSKIISVNTHIPTYQELEKFMVSFEVEEPISNNEAQYLDQEALDFPLAILSYYDKVENFEGNDVYALNIKKALMTRLNAPSKDMAMADAEKEVVLGKR